MDPKELRGLMEAYAKVNAPIEELYKGKHGQSETEYMDSRSDAGKQISGTSKLSGAAYSHRSYKGVGGPAKPGQRQQHQGKMTPADRDELAIRKSNLKKEEVEQVDENRYAMRNPEEYERAQRKPRQKSERERRMNDPHTGINSPAFQQFMKQQMSSGGGKKKTNEEVDVFDVVLEYLIFSGEAETEQEALYIMANEQEVVEAYVDYRRGKLPSGRTPQQAAKGRESALKARQKKDEVLGKGSNPETYQQRGRLSKQSDTVSQMDRATTLGSRFPTRGNPGIVRGEPNTGRHQSAITKRDAIKASNEADKKTRG